MNGLRVVPVTRTAQAGTVLRVVDGRSGRVAEVEPGYRRPLRAVPCMLDALHRLEREPGLPDGSRFETAAHLDRVLGLDLTREVGRPHPPRSAP